MKYINLLLIKRRRVFLSPLSLTAHMFTLTIVYCIYIFVHIEYIFLWAARAFLTQFHSQGWPRIVRPSTFYSINLNRKRAQQSFLSLALSLFFTHFSSFLLAHEHSTCECYKVHALFVCSSCHMDVETQSRQPDQSPRRWQQQTVSGLNLAAAT